MPLNQRTKDILKAYLMQLRLDGDLKPDNYLFHPQGRPWRAMTRKAGHDIIKKAKDKAGLTGKIATHSMRKTFGCDYYILTKDILSTGAALGHTDIKNTPVYLKAVVLDHRNVVDKF